MLDEYAGLSRKVAGDTGTQLLDLRKAFLDHRSQHNAGGRGKGVLTTDGLQLNLVTLARSHVEEVRVVDYGGQSTTPPAGF